MRKLLFFALASFFLTSCVETWPDPECRGNARPACDNGGMPVCGSIATIEIHRGGGPAELRYDRPLASCLSGTGEPATCANEEPAECIPYRQVTLSDEDYMAIRCPADWAPCGYEWPRIDWPNPWQIWNSR